jgi:type IV pilus assembly protein PilM
MSLLSGIRDFVGLDIGTSAVRVVQLRSAGKTKVLLKHGSMPLDPKLLMSESKADQQRIGTSIVDLLGQLGITTKHVAVGLPSGRVFTTIVDLDNLKQDELNKTIQFQADSLIPTPLSQSKIDWKLIGASPRDPAKVEVLLSSVTNEFIEARLDMLESVGLNVIAFEPDTIALSRSLLDTSSMKAQLLLDVGVRTTDLVITLNGLPRLTRSIPYGTEAIIRSAEQTLSLDAKQAAQFVFKFGLVKDKLEGQIYNAIIGTVDMLNGEVEKSVKFFQDRYKTGVDRIIVTGDAAALPEFPQALANKFATNVEIGNSWRNVMVPPELQQQLAAATNHFAVASGLAQRIE